MEDFAYCGNIHINLSRCIRYTFSKTHCRECVGICPADAIQLKPYPVINNKKCLKCGLCYSVCKFSAFEMDKDDYALLQEIQKNQVDIGCIKSNAQIKITCISRLTEVILLSYLFAHGSITIKTGKCKSCKLKDTLELFKKNLKKTVILAEGFGIKPNIKLKQDPSNSMYIPQESLSRREIFTAFTKKIKRDTKPTKRELLIKLINSKTIEEDLEYPEAAEISINNQCNLCGVCEHICPDNAILIKKESETGILLFNPSLCLNCKECEDACIRGAITVKDGKLHNLMEKPGIVFEAKKFTCSQCGKPFYSKEDTDLCPICKNLADSKKQFIEFLKNI